MLFNKRLKELRIINGYTVEALGNRLGVSKSTISYYESGKRFPTLDNLQSLTDIFNVSLDYLIGNDNYVVADNDLEYGMHLSKEEILFIKELRKYQDTYNYIINDPKRSAILIVKKLS